MADDDPVPTQDDPVSTGRNRLLVSAIKIYLQRLLLATPEVKEESVLKKWWNRFMLVSYIATSCLSWYFRAVPLASSIILVFNIPVFIVHMTVISEEGKTVNPVENWRLTVACLFDAMHRQEEPEGSFSAGSTSQYGNPTITCKVSFVT